MLRVCTGEYSLAPGLIFNEDEHTYFYKGKKFNGVTGKISKRLGLNYSADNIMENRCEGGSYIHKWVSDWIRNGDFNTVHPDAVWIKQGLERKYAGPEEYVAYSEVLVSDGIGTSSAIDILIRRPDGSFDILDIKTGAVKTEYLSWQLGVYKYFLSLAGLKVTNCWCTASKDRMFYKILPRSEDDVKKLLYGK